MFFLTKFIKSSFNISYIIFSFPPPTNQILNNFELTLINQLNIEASRSLLLHQYTLIQYNCALLCLIFLEDRSSHKLFLPKWNIIRYNPSDVLKECIIDAIRVASFKRWLKLFNSFFEFFGGFKLKV